MTGRRLVIVVVHFVCVVFCKVVESHTPGDLLAFLQQRACLDKPCVAAADAAAMLLHLLVCCYPCPSPRHVSCLHTADLVLEGLALNGTNVEEYVRETLGEDTCDARRSVSDPDPDHPKELEGPCPFDDGLK
jgi:hypothetical protein